MDFGTACAPLRFWAKISVRPGRLALVLVVILGATMSFSLLGDRVLRFLIQECKGFSNGVPPVSTPQPRNVKLEGDSTDRHLENSILQVQRIPLDKLDPLDMRTFITTIGATAAPSELQAKAHTNVWEYSRMLRFGLLSAGEAGFTYAVSASRVEKCSYALTVP
jgi:hypothetical protein